MADSPVDPLAHRARADALVERAAAQLQALLGELTGALDPFPSFLNLATLQAVEAEPSGSFDPERGCVVVCPDGKLYELVLRIIPGSFDEGLTDQVEELKPLELPPAEAIPYLRAAIQSLSRILLEREGEAY